jgi:RNA polymerase sigma-70 factor (ECF subfamily)
MAETDRATLRSLLQAGYEDLRQRLARRLGSTDRANDALQETFLRLECAPTIGPVSNPQAYLLRVALNVASNLRVAETRRLTAPETEALLALPDDKPGPGQIAEARSEIAALKRALGELPTRRRAIFLAAWRDGEAHQGIADRLGVSLRTIQIELKQAAEHCAVRLGRNSIKKFASGRRRLSPY